MKFDWLIFIGLIVAVAIVMAIVGFIGNKAVDGAANAMRSRRVQKQRQQAPQQPQSLAARYQQPQGQQAAAPAKQPVSDAPVSVPAQAKYCMACGRPLREGALFCSNCGTKVGEC